MLNQMMNYLRIKQETINCVDWNEELLTNEEISQWENELSMLSSMEPTFLVITSKVYNHVRRQLQSKIPQTQGKLQESLDALSKRISKTHQACLQQSKYRDDYFQWISLIRIDPISYELRTEELLRQVSLDYTNMQALLNQENDKLIGNYDFLTTLNFTMTIFSHVYEERKDLLLQSREIIEQGLLVNSDRTFQKIAKKLMKRLDFKLENQKPKQKEKITNKFNRVLPKK